MPRISEMASRLFTVNVFVDVKIASLPPSIKLLLLITEPVPAVMLMPSPVVERIVANAWLLIVVVAATVAAAAAPFPCKVPELNVV